MSSAEGADDLTRKQRREQARSNRRAIEEAQLAQAARRRRLIQLAAALGVAVVVVVVAIVLSTGGSSKTSKLSQKASPVVSSAVTTLLGGIPQSGNTLGSPKAPVTMQYYGDLECPQCQAFTLNTLPSVITNQVRTGKIQIQYRALQTATQSQSTFQTQQVAALAAGKQNKMWQYLELFYREQGQEGTGYVTESYLQGLAQQVPGLVLPAWQSARGDGALAQQVTADAQSATQSSFNSTPTLVVRGPHGAKAVSGNVPYSTVAQMIQGVS